MIKRLLFFTISLILLGSCKDECITCNGINGYPNSTICKDTYETTADDASPGWGEYQQTAVNAGCVKQ